MAKNKSDDNIMYEISEQLLQLEENRFITLYEKLGCEHCTNSTCIINSYNKPTKIIDCPKKGKILKVFVNYISAIPIYFLFISIFHYTDKRFFLSLFISLIVIGIYDTIFVLIEKIISRHYENLEIKRKNEYESKIAAIVNLRKEQEELSKQKEEIEKIKEQKIETAKSIYKTLNTIKNAQPINAISQYSEMLDVLKEICKNLKEEHLKDYNVNSLFNVQLPEVAKYCKEVKMQYNKGILSSDELTLFEEVIISLVKRLKSINRIMCQPQREELVVGLQVLNKQLKDANECDINLYAQTTSTNETLSTKTTKI